MIRRATRTAGVGRDAVMRNARLNSAATRRRLREMAEIMLVREGRAEAVRRYLGEVALGGFA